MWTNFTAEVSTKAGEFTTAVAIQKRASLTSISYLQQKPLYFTNFNSYIVWSWAFCAIYPTSFVSFLFLSGSAACNYWEYSLRLLITILRKIKSKAFEKTSAWACICPCKIRQLTIDVNEKCFECKYISATSISNVL